jgi:hypothetical protein
MALKRESCARISFSSLEVGFGARCKAVESLGCSRVASRGISVRDRRIRHGRPALGKEGASGSPSRARQQQAVRIMPGLP